MFLNLYTSATTIDSHNNRFTRNRKGFYGTMKFIRSRFGLLGIIWLAVSFFFFVGFMSRHQPPLWRIPINPWFGIKLNQDRFKWLKSAVRIRRQGSSSYYWDHGESQTDGQDRSKRNHDHSFAYLGYYYVMVSW